MIKDDPMMCNIAIKGMHTDDAVYVILHCNWLL